MGDSQRLPSLNVAEGQVRGGRLGRDHTLDDVPNHFLRDQAMGYINTQLPEDQRHAARKAVFPDLSEAELEEYVKLIQQQQEQAEREKLALIDTEEKRMESEARAAATKQYYERVENSISRLNDALSKVDENRDLTPRFGCGTLRDFGSVATWESIIRPGSAALPEEEGIDAGTQIDRDYDQVRT